MRRGIYYITCPRCGKTLLSETRKERLCSTCKKLVEKDNFEKKAKRCQLCGKKFLPKNKGQKYCSYKCSHLAMRKGRFVLCDNCHRKIWKTEERLEKGKNHFCSWRCFIRYRRRGNKNKDVPLVITKEIKTAVALEFGDKCGICGKTPTPPEVLSIHHINGNNKDNRKVNLIPLCKSCHRKIHNNSLGLGKRKLRQIVNEYI